MLNVLGQINLQYNTIDINSKVMNCVQKWEGQTNREKRKSQRDRQQKKRLKETEK
jgi:hypothetical protein